MKKIMAVVFTAAIFLIYAPAAISQVESIENEDIRYLSSPYFPDDYPKRGREFWAQLSYQF